MCDNGTHAGASSKGRQAFYQQLAAACASKTPEMRRSKRFESVYAHQKTVHTRVVPHFLSISGSRNHPVSPPNPLYSRPAPPYFVNWEKIFPIKRLRLDPQSHLMGTVLLRIPIGDSLQAVAVQFHRNGAPFEAAHLLIKQGDCSERVVEGDVWMPVKPRAGHIQHDGAVDRNRRGRVRSQGGHSLPDRRTRWRCPSARTGAGAANTPGIPHHRYPQYFPSPYKRGSYRPGRYPIRRARNSRRANGFVSGALSSGRRMRI